MIGPDRHDPAALYAFTGVDVAARVGSYEMRRIFVTEALNRLGVGVVLVIVRADEQVYVEFFGRDKYRRLARQVHAGRRDVDATIRQVEIGSDDRAFVRFEDKPVLSEPPEGDFAPLH